uniref:Uncharacterized protein n=1 Tax=Sinocyclocheilus rhinocerous TaxID=307959 RepID=A0A673I519_9TELE
NPLLLRELNLSECKLGDSNVNRLAALLLSDCSITEEGYKALASALRSNPSHLIELDLTGNDPGQSGVKQLNDLLQDPNCQLKTLSLCECSITEKQCLILTSALKTNPSHLRELDLSENKLQNRGVKILCDVVKDSDCKLERLRSGTFMSSHICEKVFTLFVRFFSFCLIFCSLSQCRLRYCDMTDEGCSAVTSALQPNPSNLRELDLSGNQLGVENLGVLSSIRSFHFFLFIFSLCGCSITEKQCLSLSSALRSNLSHLRELDLSENELKNTGVNHLCDVLKDSHCKLERLRLGCCDVTDEGCSAVTSALKSNPSHLRELNLSGNQLGDSGVKHLCDLLRNPQCKLEKLELRYCDITDDGCSALTSALRSNPSHLRELDLSGNKVKNKGVKHLCDVLKNLDCKLERLSGPPGAGLDKPDLQVSKYLVM